MAKASAINRNEKRITKVKSQAKKRAKLKETIMDRELPVEERFAATLKLGGLSRNGAKNRVRNRCALTGRARGYLRKFGLCRNEFRRLASFGHIPGVTKSSW